MNIIEKTYKWASKLSKRKSTNRIILHHAEATKCTADQIHSWHLANGWAGIGYHFFVRKDGSIYRGRPEDVIGSHAKGANSDSIGICAEGSYMKETMPEAQKRAIKELIVYLKNKYGIAKVQRHKDVTSTNCPGINFPFDEIVNGSASTSQPNQGTSGVNYKVKVNTPSGVNCRKTPNGDKITAFPNGAVLNITKEQNGWGYANNTGWVKLEYCSKIADAPKPQPAPTSKALGTYEVTANDLSVRTGPGTDYRRKTYAELTADAKKHDYDKDGCLNKGTHVTVKEWSNGWARIPSGWVSGDYLRKV